MTDAQDVDKQKVVEMQKRKLQQESEMLANQLRTAFGYSPWLNQKANNYRTQRMQMRPLENDLEYHARRDHELQPLQKLIQEERERVMVMEKGIDTEQTTRFFIEKIKEYNSIIDLEHLKRKPKNSEQTITQEINNDIMKRYTGDQGQITNFHFVLNWQNLVPVFKELGQEQQVPKQKSKLLPRKKLHVGPRVKAVVNHSKKSLWIRNMEQKFKEIDKKFDESLVNQQQQQYQQQQQQQQQQTDFELVNTGLTINNIVSAKSRASILTHPSTVRNSQAIRTSSISKKLNTQKQETVVLHEEQTVVSQASSRRNSKVHNNKEELIAQMINQSFDQESMIAYLSNKEELFKYQVHSKLLRSMVRGKLTDYDTQTFQNNQSVKKQLEISMQQYLIHHNPELLQLFNPQEQNQLQEQFMQKVNNKKKDKLIPLSPVQPPVSTKSNIKQKRSFSSQDNNINSIQDSDPQLRGDKFFTHKKPQIIRIRSISDHAVQTQPEQEIKLAVLENDPIPSYQESSTINYKANNKKRQAVIDQLIARKQPKFVHPGGTKFAILNTPENIKLYKTKKTRIEEQQLEEIEKFKQRPVRAQEHMMTNLQVLQGPPKKLEFNTTDLKHDYNDMKVSKMMKQLLPNKGQQK